MAFWMFVLGYNSCHFKHWAILIYWSFNTVSNSNYIPTCFDFYLSNASKLFVAISFTHCLILFRHVPKKQQQLQHNYQQTNSNNKNKNAMGETILLTFRLFRIVELVQIIQTFPRSIGIVWFLKRLTESTLFDDLGQIIDKCVACRTFVVIAKLQQNFFFLLVHFGFVDAQSIHEMI